MQEKFFFDTFSWHPGPDNLESYTGYLIRIADLNGIKNLTGLSRLTNLERV
jgi:hypothetical protein